MPGIRPTEREAIALLKKLGCDEALLDHCRLVADVAAKIALKYLERGMRVNLNLVRVGALLHDIGRTRTHGVEHGIVGGQIARELSLEPAIVSIIERHVLAGISSSEAGEFGLPPRDYVPRTLEEKIVAYADKMVEGSKVAPVDSFIRSIEKWLGSDHSVVARLKQLQREFSEILGGELLR